MNETPTSTRTHIGFFGRRNAGKSSLVNAVTGQNLSIVSEVKGTTTDPVLKAMELLPMGPVVVIDTPGIDDQGSLGEQRILKTKQVLNKTDVAVLVVDAVEGRTAADEELIAIFRERQTPFIVAFNKTDLIGTAAAIMVNENEILVSARTKEGVDALKEKIAALAVTQETKLHIVGDLLHPGDFAVLVTPIDKAAPKGRLILPQQQTIRDILEAEAAAIVVKEYELRDTLAHLGKKPRLVITDSQVFAKVSADTPRDVPLTSFSILFARLNGFLSASIEAVKTLDSLEDGDVVLLAEGCTHHRQCDDIGTVKIPRWVKNYANKEVNFEFTSGGDFPVDLSRYRLVIHCGGCMLNRREMRYRQRRSLEQNVPIINYGVLIAHIQGILERCVEVFK
ncbi:MAG: [FeFe] hydrogenase H-cluster maturation GTPase HydF [Treponema sp.]|jgi:[FeFe] hydrogenase H-cluster maturation GTPase HydF|nr:[FeFe] hydrogenase H-cluster maturation GTPase HydF [Treponema sp.]